MYEFGTLDGDVFVVIETDDPFAHVGELSSVYGVDADEIVWEAI